MEVEFKESGVYPICFYKETSAVAEVMFDVQAMEDRLLTAGKEDVNKLSRRIS